MIQTNNDPIKIAIEVAEQEVSQLTEKIKEFEMIEKRLSRLKAFIDMGKGLLGIPLQKSIPFPETPNENRSEKLLDRLEESQTPQYVRAREILIETGKQMELTEIVDEFRKRGWRLSPSNGREVLRFALNKRPEIFKKHKDGRYSLVERRD